MGNTTIADKITNKFGVPSATTIMGALRNVADGKQSGDSIAEIIDNIEGGGGSSAQEDALFADTAETYINKTASELAPYAIYRKDSLKTVAFENVETLYGYTFYSCTNLEKVTFPKLKNLGSTVTASSIFPGCSKLNTIEAPLVQYIGYNALGGFKYLSNISFPECITIASLAFAQTSFVSASLPKVTTVGNSAFASCISLASLALPEATDIGANAFGNCRSLKSLDLPKVSTIGSSAFRSCTSLTSLNIPNAVSLNSSMFYSCSYITYLNVENLQSMGYATFSNMSRLRSIAFYSISGFADRAFNNCYTLSALYLLMPWVLSSNYTSMSSVFYNTPFMGPTPTGEVEASIYVPASLYNDYIHDDYWLSKGSRVNFVSLTDEEIAALDF